MCTIDRYMLRQFIQVFCICFISLTGLYVVIDAFGNLDEFIGYGESEGSVFAVMGRYYALRTIAFFDRISAILALISAMFTVTWIQRHHELTALMAAGIPPLRVIMPVIVAAASISGLAAANRELVIPQIRNVLGRNAQDLLGENGRDVRPCYDNRTEVLLRGGKTFAKDERINKPSFLLPPTLDKHGKHLAAENAYYRRAEGDRPSGYLFSKVREPRDLAKLESLKLDGEPIVLTPRDAAWLKPDECFLVTDISFEMLEGGSSWCMYSSTADLIKGLKNPSLGLGADVRVLLHRRFVQPFLDVTLLFLGLPLVLARGNRNVFFAIGLCVALATTFLGVGYACQYLGNSYFVPAALAAWLPLMIFVPVAVGMSESLKR